MLQQKSKTKGDKAELIFYISLIAFPLIQVLIFYFVVNFNSFLLAFKDYDYEVGVYFNKQDLFVNFKRFNVSLFTLVGFPSDSHQLQNTRRLPGFNPS